ncbi:LOB domain-containing protein 39 [Morella rubra]|uniref:LOB domain-containing protein 39 n=1 Tax=Morella rubra TaxID=262757 RepID=A0A6A1UUU5_9ROSI|nr:LOB domain-containing protein 39 [Morella rubra]
MLAPSWCPNEVRRLSKQHNKEIDPTVKVHQRSKQTKKSDIRRSIYAKNRVLRKHGAALAQSLEDILHDLDLDNRTPPWVPHTALPTQPGQHPHPHSHSSVPWLDPHDKSLREGKMSCNGCRVLRKGCSETCVLRSCLQWIESPAAQGNAVLLLAKFFGRSDLISFVSAVPEPHRAPLFQSLLYEACGRTVNPVDGAVGLLSRGKWHVCQLAVETVLAGGTLRPMTDVTSTGILQDALRTDESTLQNLCRPSAPYMHEAQPSDPPTLALAPKFADDITSAMRRPAASPWSHYPRVERSIDVTASLKSEESETTNFGSSGDDRQLLNLFV